MSFVNYQCANCRLVRHWAYVEVAEVKVEYASVSALEAWCELRRVCPPQTSSRTINIKQRANAPDIPDTARPAVCTPSQETMKRILCLAGHNEG
jgi:hypothetical protein